MQFPLCRILVHPFSAQNRLGSSAPLSIDACGHAGRKRSRSARDDFAVVGSAVGEQIAAQGAAELVIDHFLAPRASALVMD